LLSIRNNNEDDGEEQKIAVAEVEELRIESYDEPGFEDREFPDEEEP